MKEDALKESIRWALSLLRECLDIPRPSHAGPCGFGECDYGCVEASAFAQGIRRCENALQGKFEPEDQRGTPADQLEQAVNWSFQCVERMVSVPAEEADHLEANLLTGYELISDDYNGKQEFMRKRVRIP